MEHPTFDGNVRMTLSRAERYERGKALREKVSRESHADHPAAPGRDPIALLVESDRGRLAELLPIRYERMQKSPFTFLRGAASVMATDLAGFPEVGAPVQACGDCHLMNFGVFRTPEGGVLFDINDFDETLPGIDFVVDVKRLVASVAVAARDASLSDKKAKALAHATAQSYREFVRKLARLSPLEVWYTHMDLAIEAKRIDDAKLRDKIIAILVKEKADLAADNNFPHLAPKASGGERIEDRPPLIYHLDADGDQKHRIHADAAFSNYRHTLLPERSMLFERYEFRDLAFKVVGIGSVGTFCAVGLFLTPDDDPLFLQVKEARASVLETITAPAESVHEQGRRVVDGQRRMQAATDLFLGWTQDSGTGRHFYVRQLKNRRLGSIAEVIEARALEAYANICARTLARAHARTGDPALLAGYMGKSEVFDDALASFAMAYADQTARDHARLRASIDPATGLPVP